MTTRISACSAASRRQVDADSVRYNAAIGAWRRHGNAARIGAFSRATQTSSRRAPSPVVPRSLPAGKSKVAIALDSFSRLAHAKWRRAPSAIIPQSVPGGEPVWQLVLGPAQFWIPADVDDASGNLHSVAQLGSDLLGLDLDVQPRLLRTAVHWTGRPTREGLL